MARAAALCLLAACGSDEPAPARPITVVTFNVAGDTLRDPIAGPTMALQVARANPDFAALQECVGCTDFVALLPPHYALAPLDGAVTIAYDASRWEPLDTGLLILGDNDDGWGRRDAVYTRLLDGGLVDVLRAVSTDPTPTFQGNSWAPPGRIDYLFAASPLHVSSAIIDSSAPLNTGSDHRPVIATLSFTGGS